MPATSTLGFTPNFHNITPERVAFVYNADQSGSLNVAQYYCEKRGLPTENLIGLNITLPTISADGATCETVLLNETDYMYQIENPLLDALDVLGTNFSTDGGRSIWVIILGFGIPLAYDDNGETVAIASRLHRLGHSISHKYPNPTYDRRGQFKFFDSTDASEMFLTAVLDGPTETAVKKLIDRSLDVSRQTFITGNIVVDPYGKKITAADLDYQQDILDFIDQELPFLDIDSQLTVDIDDPYEEPTVASFQYESFYWGWYNPAYSRQLFLNQNERRVFLYNADDRAACNIHFYLNGSPFDENGSDHWCNIAINIEPGYATCAGSVDDPGSDAFLRPIPFFHALHQGSTIAEAFLFASKYVSWKTVLIGDPLMTVNFPVDLPSDQDTTFTLLPNNEVVLREKEYIETSLGWGARQSRLLSEILDTVVASDKFNEALNLLRPITYWKRLKDTKAQTDLHLTLVSRWVRYIQSTTNLSVNQWLEQNSYNVTQRLREVIQETGAASISDDNVAASGFWEFTFTYEHQEQTLENVFFELEVSRSNSFDSASLLIDRSTLTDVTGWKYEGQLYTFVQMPESGFPSNFSGRRVRFSSPARDYLRSTETYYVRWTAVDSNGMPFDNATGTEQIIIVT